MIKTTCLLLGALTICASTQDLLTPPEEVRFDSLDYKNILHWTSRTNCSSLQYDVQWKIYGEPEWLNVKRCQGINTSQCDLSSVTSDTREWYFARVCATCVSTSMKSAWSLSPKFSPRWDTKISPPTLKLKLNKQAIAVHVKPPRLLVRKKRNSLHHKIYVNCRGGEEEVFEMDCCSMRLTLTNLTHNTTYCIQAQSFILLEAKTSARSSLTCITTP